MTPATAGEVPAEQTMSIPVATPTPGPGEVDDVVAELGIELRPGTAMLVVRRGPNAGAKFLLDAEVVGAGRHPDSAVFLDDVTVSRRHAELRRRPGGHLIRDVGSLNGTYVNRDRVDEVGLVHGDEIQIGKYRLLYLSGDSPADRDPDGSSQVTDVRATGAPASSRESAGGATG